MIIITKKRVQIIISCIILAVCVFSFKIAKNPETNYVDQLEKQKTQETVATPVSGKTIVVDARTWSS